MSASQKPTVHMVDRNVFNRSKRIGTVLKLNWLKMKINEWLKQLVELGLARACVYCMYRILHICHICLDDVRVNQFVQLILIKIQKIAIKETNTEEQRNEIW